LNWPLEDGRKIRTIGEKGQQVKLSGFKNTVSASWFYLKRNGKLEKRFVISTRKLKGNTITWWGRRRRAIEGFFKTSKYRFGLIEIEAKRSLLASQELRLELVQIKI
jgi:hypothetical protein